MATECFEECHYHKALIAFRIQANMKRKFFHYLQTTLGNILAMEIYLDSLNMPGWTRPINKVSVMKTIDEATEAKNKCIEDIDTIENTIKNGCHHCNEWREKSQIGQIQEILLTPIQEQERLKSLNDFDYEEFDLNLLLDDNALLDPTPLPTPTPNIKENWTPWIYA